jgi:hypothetical protein
MGLLELYRPFLGPLEELGLPYVITGSIAAAVYGEPRLTRDIDIVLLMRIQDIARLRAAFREDLYYVPPVEALATEALRDGGGEKHQRDIRYIVESTDLDDAFVQEHVRRLGLHEVWARCSSGPVP